MNARILAFFVYLMGMHQPHIATLSPLSLAIQESNFTQVVTYVTYNPYLLNALDYSLGYTPLALALMCHNESIALYLLDQGARIDIPDARQGIYPIHMAATNGLVGALINIIDRTLNLNITTPWGETALHLAANYGQINTFTILINAGADSTLMRPDGLTAGQVALLNAKMRDGLYSQYVAIVHFLKSRNKDPIQELMARSRHPVLNTHPISESLFTEHTPIAHPRIAIPSPIKHPTPSYNSSFTTPATPQRVPWAEEKREKPSQSLSPAHKASCTHASADQQIIHNPSIKASSQDKPTALHRAVLYRAHAEAAVLEILKENPELINARDEKGATALHWACSHEQGTPCIAQLLLEYKADPLIFDRTPGQHSLPLHRACNNKNGAILITLLLQHAPESIHTYSSSGLTPLHIATNKGSLENIEALIRHGANPYLHSQRAHGKRLTAFALAQKAHHGQKMRSIHELLKTTSSKEVII